MYTVHSCPCGYTFSDTPTSATGHDYEIVSHNSNGTHNIKCKNDAKHTEVISCVYTNEVTAPTCTTDGYTTHTCECGYTFIDNVVPKLGHDYEVMSHNFDGTHNLSCKNDVAHTETAACKYESVTTVPTCTTDGYTTHTCECGYTFTDSVVPRLNHDYKIISTNSNGTHNVKCTRDASHTDTVACDYITVVIKPTCVTEGYTVHACVCGYSYADSIKASFGHDYEIISSNHNGTHNSRCSKDITHTTIVLCEYTDVVTRPTSSEQGYTTHTCACGHSYVDSYVDAGTEPNCLSAGHVFGNDDVCMYCDVRSDDIFTFTLNGDTYAVSKKEESLIIANIPATYNGKAVTSIGSSAFRNCNELQRIEIPNSITSIGAAAFYGCRVLEYTTYNGGLYLGNTDNPYLVLVDTTERHVSTFTTANTTKIICDSAFNYCEDLVTVTISSSVISIDCNAFYESIHPRLTFEDTSGWYEATDYNNWVERTGGTQIDVSLPIDKYGGVMFEHYYLYKL